MLDLFEVITTSGVVLWSKSYAPVKPSIINSLISDVFIEERNQPGSDGKWFKKDSYTLKWTLAADVGLVFVAVYQSLIHLTWIDELLDQVKKLFVALYGEKIKASTGTKIQCHFDQYFEASLRSLERQAGGAATTRTTNVSTDDPSSDGNGGGLSDGDEWSSPPPMPGVNNTGTSDFQHRTPYSSEKPNPLIEVTPSATSAPVSPATMAQALLQASGRRPGRPRRNRKSAGPSSASSTHASSGEERSPARLSNKPKRGKAMRIWGEDGIAAEANDERKLDYSAGISTDDEQDTFRPKPEAIDQDTWGTRTNKGDFLLKDLDYEIDGILKQANSAENNEETNRKGPGGIASGFMGGAMGYLRNFVGGKTLTREDTEKAISGVMTHLLEKNVAREAAVQICDSVQTSLVGQKTGSFQSIESLVKLAMEDALRKILTPTTSLDLLREIGQVRETEERPYVISVVGVNGVGKSTNLSKISFFLLQNKLKVLIAACDTFRSGAVEQLRVHARNLKELSEREGGVVELYEKGYGKDAANIAKDAVSYAGTNGFDVVLIDTAGRRHNDQRLMSSLEKFAKFANPDKILMVGEALVGSDSVQQARNFNAAFGKERKLDGFIISKCDTVGDMVGTLISMVFATGIPVVFLGVGQNYTDLRTLNVKWAVGLLMS
ncbi:hypothetical protein TWF569_002134 [Orbilia oligospora]|uniref:Signal recognition particle receptor subunit alpha homolog n=1 Tax=Orbilia oligospora TaxID=2813651 RepID=A0A7C8K0L4_ORBOL|nr:hypothetical protein TWF103_002572 [Orbilia oligospora]KAF3093093.1 hypothetical protein TWF102_008031 [Orbilia oligospora]KAF3122603.1 hypothetical protein TWF569_002134 [Orbilia oligospora]KAF3127694.1 hypothetical protein TWF594_000622 [Orbilia oligospora]KAF3129784.1 hypothetical protein TWF703_008522 [Orbilia oligospora]